MLDFLFALGQFFSVLGLLYGLFLVLAHSNCVDEMRQQYDPITGHDWLAIRIVRQHAASRASTPPEGESPRERSASTQFS